MGSAMEAKLPPTLKLEGNIAENYRKFKQAFNIYLIASEKSNKSDEVKVALWLNLIGEEAVEIFNNFPLEEKERKVFKKVVEEFDKYMNPKKNVIYERFLFNTRKQENGEPFDVFLQDVKKLANTCEFMDPNEMVRDRLVLGINDKVLQERLLGNQDLTLEKCVEKCRCYELTQQQMKNLKEEALVDGIKTENSKKGQYKKEYYCRRCQTKHKPRSCPAYGKKCEKCGMFNHLAVACRSGKDKKVSEIAQEEEYDEDRLYVSSLSICEVSHKSEWTQVLKIGKSNVEFKIDTGAEVSILLEQDLNKVLEKNAKIIQEIKPTTTVLEAYGGNRIKPVGKVELICSLGNKRFNISFMIVNGLCKRSILGLPECKMLNIVKKIDLISYTNIEQFIKNNEILFNGLGKFKDKCTIKLKKDCKPVALPPRRVPLAIRQRLKAQLDRLEQKGIITKVDEPVEWLSNLVIIEKNDGSLRICLDPQELNKAIDREYYMIPTLEDVASKLKGKVVFTVLGLKEGFYQAELDYESSKLCSFNSPFGSYRFNRLAFGLNLAPEWFQKINEKYFGDIDGVTVYFDDLIIAASSEDEHDVILSKVVQRAKENNVKFNKNKIQLKQPRVKYLGQVFDASGMHCDEEKVKAIRELEPPRNRKELQSILGMVNYLRAYIPNLAELTTSLRLLLKKENDFVWLPCHTKDLNKIKEVISSAPVLAAFDATLLPVILTDASKDGIGSVLIQNGKPVAFTSRSLTETQKEYAQIEKELLAVVHAVNKFHLYVYGRKFRVYSDHKPLVSIMNKSISKIYNHRLQRLKLKLLKYDFELKFKPGKEQHIADLLSRNFIRKEIYDDQSIEEMVHSVSVHLQMSEPRKNEFKKHTFQDPELSTLIKYAQNGWPVCKKNVPLEVIKYWELKEDIYLSDELVFYKDRVIVPGRLRQEMLQLLQEGHLGITKMKLRAKEVLFWPGMNYQIENMVKNCVTCENYQPANSNNILMPHELPKRPFEKVSADLLDYGGKSFLVLVDYYSKWVELIPLKGKSAVDVIQAFKMIFSSHGIPSKIICDNMPFNSYACKKFSELWDFQIITSSPYLSRSNGQAESAVKIAKSILRKNEDTSLALLQYRCTPLPHLNLSPAQLLFGRRLRPKLPISDKLLNPKAEKQEHIYKKLNEKQMLYKNYFDKTATSLKQLSPGDDVLINTNTNNSKKWERGQIIECAPQPRSYIVKTSEGGVVRRSRQHLRKSNNETIFKSAGETDLDEQSDVVINEQESLPNDRPIRQRRLPSRFRDFAM